MFKRIIVPVDGSEHSHRALTYAQAMADKFGATLWLVHAFPQTSDLLGYDEFEKLIARRESTGQEILDQAREQVGDRLDVREELLEEPAAEAIIRVAHTREADLIIMGTRGLGSLQGLLMGSVSHKVLNHAPCPVMLIR
jgi:nucleotide-binding universal stress UspA family protein